MGGIYINILIASRQWATAPGILDSIMSAAMISGSKPSVCFGLFIPNRQPDDELDSALPKQSEGGNVTKPYRWSSRTDRHLPLGSGITGYISAQGSRPPFGLAICCPLPQNPSLEVRLWWMTVGISRSEISIALAAVSEWNNDCHGGYGAKEGVICSSR